jgi:hypothetical protein
VRRNARRAGTYLLGTWGLPDGLVATLHRGRGGDCLAELVCSAHTGVAAAGPASPV